MLVGCEADVIVLNGVVQMVRAPSAGKSLPSASKAKAATISDEDIERQLKALGMD